MKRDKDFVKELNIKVYNQDKVTKYKEEVPEVNVYITYKKNKTKSSRRRDGGKMEK